MKDILILHTGGTFGMVPMKPRHTLSPGQVQKRITTYVPELEQIAHIDFKMLFNLDSANMQPHHWQELASEIYTHIDQYEGFVVIHGTDSMVYTASALSFMLRNLPRPVILTGSQRPLAEIRTDARMNLINAVELATRRIPEVGIFFGTQLYRGNRTIKVSSTDYGAFESPNFPALAEVGLDINVSRLYRQPADPFHLLTEVVNRVMVIRVFPGLPPAHLKNLVNSSVQAVVIEALGIGNLPVEEKSFVPLVKALTGAGKLVVITSQSRHGYVDLSRYQNGLLIEEAGATGAGDMTTEATIVKLMHLLGCYPDNIPAVREMIHRDIAGEISEPRK